MTKRKLPTIDMILIILTTFFWIILIVFLIWKLAGRSPTEVTILTIGFGFVLTLLGFILKNLMTIKMDIGEFKEFKRNTVEKIRDIDQRLRNKKI